MHKTWPIIAPSIEHYHDAYNAVLLPLSIELNDPLFWEDLEAKAHEIIQKGSKIVWEFELGSIHSLLDQIAFTSYQVAIEHFAARFLASFAQDTAGIILYRGSVDVSHLVRKNPVLYEDFRNEGRSSPHDLRFYSLALFSEYLHRLGSTLPESIPLFAMFDIDLEMSPSEALQLLSHEQFPHIHIGARGLLAPMEGILWDYGEMKGGYFGVEPNVEPISDVSTGIVLPPTGCDLKNIDEIIEKLKEANTPFKVIPQTLVTENWHGLDDLIVASECIDKEGIRVLQGFIAALGRAVVHGKKLGLTNECQLDEFLQEVKESG